MSRSITQRSPRSMDQSHPSFRSCQFSYPLPFRVQVCKAQSPLLCPVSGSLHAAPPFPRLDMPLSEVCRTGLERGSSRTVCKAACEDRPKLNSALFPSQCLEEVEQAVARFEAGSPVKLVWLELGQCCFLKSEVGMQIDLRRFDGFMTEPQRDHGGIDARLQKLHRSGVPQDVRRHAFGLQ